MNGVSRVVVERNKAATSVLAALMIHGRKGKAGLVPDFDWLAGMLFYVDEIVRGQHYRDEELWLLKPLEKQMPELRPRIARARRDHIGSGGYCVRMAEALTNWKRGWDKAIDMYLDNARDHYRLSAGHGCLMRRTILPAAERCLPETHWQAAAVAFARSEDPVARSHGRAEYEAALCRRMGRQMPPQGTVQFGSGQSRDAAVKSNVTSLAQEAR